MPYREIIEISENEMIELELVVDGVAIAGLRKPAFEAFKIAAAVYESEKPKLHHSQKFEIKIMLDNG